MDKESNPPEPQPQADPKPDLPDPGRPETKGRPPKEVKTR
jgi:hypothetical protein